MRYLSILNASFLLVFGLTLFAPAQAEDEPIKKFCNTQTGDARYTNVGFAPVGYEECGSVSSAILCDTTGHKFFGKGAAPEVFKDCNIGPRIQISGTNVNLDALKETRSSKKTEDPLAYPEEDSWDLNQKSQEPIVNSRTTPLGLSNFAHEYESYLNSLDDLLDTGDDPPAAKERIKRIKENRDEQFQKLRELISSHMK